MRSPLRRAPVLLPLIFAIACDGDGSLPMSPSLRPSGSIATVENGNVADATRFVLWSSTTGAASVGDTLRFEGAAFDRRDRRMLGVPVRYSVSDTALARIDAATGVLVVRRAGGKVVVTARAGDYTSTAQFQTKADKAGRTVLPEAPVQIVGAEQPIAVGQSAQLSVVSTTAELSPEVLRRQLPLWRSSDTTAVTVDAAGRARAMRAGATATVTAETVAGTATTQVTTAGEAVPNITVGALPTTTTVDAAAGGAASVSLLVTRFDGGTGTVLVSNAIPLRAGMLRAEDVRTVRVVVGNAEQSVYVEPTRGRHADGSLRSVLVQWRYNMGTAPSVPATFSIGGTRTVADMARPSEARGVPAAAALPTSPDYLVAANVAGPTVTAAASATMPMAAQWDANFRQFADYQWTQTRDEWGGNYYDRANIYYAMWARTGNPVYWERGTRHAMTYRTGYIEASGASSPHWAQIEGLGTHYELTGDTASITAVGTIARTIGGWFDYLGPEAADVDNRIRARSLLSMYTLWRFADASARPAIASKLDYMISASLRGQAADGSYPAGGACGGNNNFMDGMFNDVLIQLHDGYRADTRIVTAVRRSADFLWTQFRPDARAIQYLSLTCPNVGGTDPVAVLNNFVVTTFAWSYARGGGTLYRDRADQLFAGTVVGANLFNPKEFNQAYTTSFKYLAYRR